MSDVRECPGCMMRVATGKREESDMAGAEFAPLFLSCFSGGDGDELLAVSLLKMGDTKVVRREYSS